MNARLDNLQRSQREETAVGGNLNSKQDSVVVCNRARDGRLYCHSPAGRETFFGPSFLFKLLDFGLYVEFHDHFVFIRRGAQLSSTGGNCGQAIVNIRPTLLLFVTATDLYSFDTSIQIPGLEFSWSPIAISK